MKKDTLPKKCFFLRKSNCTDNFKQSSKKAILPTFLGQTPHFLCENHKTRTDHLHYQKAWSIAIIFSLRVGVQHLQKWCNNFYNAVAVECRLYLARPCTGKYTPISTGSIFSSTLPVELDLYRKIFPGWLNNIGQLNFNITLFSNWEWFVSGHQW